MDYCISLNIFFWGGGGEGGSGADHQSAGGRGFELRPDQHSASLNSQVESAAFVMVPAKG